MLTHVYCYILIMFNLCFAEALKPAKLVWTIEYAQIWTFGWLTKQGTRLLWKGIHLLCNFWGLNFYEKGLIFYGSFARHRCSPGDSTFMKRDPPFMQVLCVYIERGLTFYEEGPTFYDHQQQPNWLRPVQTLYLFLP